LTDGERKRLANGSGTVIVCSERQNAADAAAAAVLTDADVSDAAPA